MTTKENKMSDKIVNLTDLAATRAKMAPGKYVTTLPSKEHSAGLVLLLGSCVIPASRADDEHSPATVQGLAALANAADVLIEVVRMAKRLDAEDGIRDSKTGYALREILARVSL